MYFNIFHWVDAVIQQIFSLPFLSVLPYHDRIHFPFKPVNRDPLSGSHYYQWSRTGCWIEKLQAIYVAILLPRHRARKDELVCSTTVPRLNPGHYGMHNDRSISVVLLINHPTVFERVLLGIALVSVL